MFLKSSRGHKRLMKSSVYMRFNCSFHCLHMTLPAGVSLYKCQYFRQKNLLVKRSCVSVCMRCVIFLIAVTQGFSCMTACQTSVNCSWINISLCIWLQLRRATHICTSCCSLWMTHFQRKHQPNAGMSILRNRNCCWFSQLLLIELLSQSIQKEIGSDVGFLEVYLLPHQKVQAVPRYFMSRTFELIHVIFCFLKFPSERAAPAVLPSLQNQCPARYTQKETQPQSALVFSIFR